VVLTSLFIKVLILNHIITALIIASVTAEYCVNW